MPSQREHKLQEISEKIEIKKGTKEQRNKIEKKNKERFVASWVEYWLGNGHICQIDSKFIATGNTTFRSKFGMYCRQVFYWNRSAYLSQLLGQSSVKEIGIGSCNNKIALTWQSIALGPCIFGILNLSNSFVCLRMNAVKSCLLNHKY